MATPLYLTIFRANYALVVAASATFGAYCAMLALTASLGNLSAWMASAIMAFILLFLVSRVLARKCRRENLVPAPSNYRHWMFATLMTLAGAFAHFLVFVVCHALYQYRYVYPEKDVEGGPMAFFLMIATACYILAMLMGEFGLEHRQPIQPRIIPASGFAEALPGNTSDSRAADDTRK